VRFVAFPLTEYDEVLSGYQPGQMVEWWANQHFCPRPQGTVWLYPEDEDRDGLRNIGFLTAQPFDPADSPRELHHFLCYLKVFLIWRFSVLACWNLLVFLTVISPQIFSILQITALLFTHLLYHIVHQR
jgi:hypothetical protein